MSDLLLVHNYKSGIIFFWTITLSVFLPFKHQRNALESFTIICTTFISVSQWIELSNCCSDPIFKIFNTFAHAIYIDLIRSYGKLLSTERILWLQFFIQFLIGIRRHNPFNLLFAYWNNDKHTYYAPNLFDLCLRCCVQCSHVGVQWIRNLRHAICDIIIIEN